MWLHELSYTPATHCIAVHRVEEYCSSSFYCCCCYYYYYSHSSYYYSYYYSTTRALHSIVWQRVEVALLFNYHYCYYYSTTLLNYSDYY